MNSEVKKFIEENIDLIENENFQEMFNLAHKKLSCAHALELRGVLYSAGVCCNERSTSPNILKHRIHQIKCYNVGFGDCFLCKNENTNSKMLIDCGTQNSFKNTDVTDDIYLELAQADEKNIMISHLHEDHYNGISSLLATYPNLQIDNVYLPNYISYGGLELYAAMVFYGKQDTDLTKVARAVLTIPGIFANNFSHYARIYFACEGKTIQNNLCTFETILPRKWFKRPCPIDNEKIREFCSRYLSILNIETSTGEGNTIEVRIVSDNNIQQEIDELLREYDNVDFPSISNSELEALKKAFKKHHNNMSLAFHEKSVCDFHNVLFWGDAEKANIKYACDTYVRTYYGFIKIPHHGTKTHFYDKLPKAKFCAISNGKYKGREITALYDVQYGDHTTFICSNNASCEIDQHNCDCRSKKKNCAKCGFDLSYSVVL